MAVDVSAVGKGRKQLAEEALRTRIKEMTARERPPDRPGVGSSGEARPRPTHGEAGPRPTHGEAGPGPTHGEAGPGPAPGTARKPVPARALMTHSAVSTALGRSTLQVVRHAPGTKGAAPARESQAGAGRRDVGGAALQQRAGSGLAGEAGERAPGGSSRPFARGGGAFYGASQPLPALRRKRRLSLDSQGSDLSDFIADEDEEDAEEEGGDWRSALRSALGGYDASRYADIDRADDRSMEVTRYADIAQEEQRSLRLAREADRREAELEAARTAAKEETKRRRRGAAAFLDDD